MVELYPYRGTWDADDPDANFKTDVALYTVADPLPTLENLSHSTGIPVPCLIRYVLVKYVASRADALLAMTPIVFRQMQQHVEKAEAAGTTEARLEAYEALHHMIDWLGLEAATWGRD